LEKCGREQADPRRGAGVGCCSLGAWHIPWDAGFPGACQCRPPATLRLGATWPAEVSGEETAGWGSVGPLAVTRAFAGSRWVTAACCWHRDSHPEAGLGAPSPRCVGSDNKIPACCFTCKRALSANRVLSPGARFLSDPASCF